MFRIYNQDIFLKITLFYIDTQTNYVCKLIEFSILKLIFVLNIPFIHTFFISSFASKINAYIDHPLF